MSSTKRKAPPVRIARPQTTQNAKPVAKSQINESQTSVVPVPKHQQRLQKKTGEAIEISSDESDNDAAAEGDDLMDEDEVKAEDDEQPQTNGHPAVNGKTTATASANGADNDDDDASANEDEDHEPTFGDLVREHETVDVTAALSLLHSADTAANGGAETTNGTIAKSGAASGAAAAPTLASLGHLLNAALRSGDDANLEVCFNTTTDAVWVRNTIQRLDPSLAGTLLQKLAARIHRRPGRAHTLIGWVQWTLITHGGALLANQPGVTRALQELHRVLEERARGLNSLLLLKGKLDMLEAQMQMRRLQRAGSGGLLGSVAPTVGGRSGSRALDSVNNVGRSRGTGSRRRNTGLAHTRGEDGDEDFVTTYREDRDGDDDDEEEDVTGQILVNGVSTAAGESFAADSEEEALDDDDDGDSEGDEEEGGDEEDEVEEMDEDDIAEDDEVDFDDVDEDDDDDDDEDDEEDQTAAAPPPSKVQKKSGGAFSKRR